MSDDLKALIEQYWQQQQKPIFNPDDPEINLHEVAYGIDEIQAALEVLLSTQVTSADKVKAFESKHAELFQKQFAVACNSGSSANLLALSALSNKALPNHIKPGDEVIVPALSWSTSVWPIVQQQLVPVFVDCDKDTLNLNPDSLQAALTNKTKAILLVHVYGNPCQLDVINSFAKDNNLWLIEDCCEAMGAEFAGQPVGQQADIATYSYYFSHHLTTMEGGMCTTDNPELGELMRVLRAHGWSRDTNDAKRIAAQYPELDPNFIFINQGYNLRLTELQAAMGLVQLPKLKAFLQARKNTAEFFQGFFNQHQNVFSLQQVASNAESAHFGFTVLVNDNAPFQTAELRNFLKQKSIQNRAIIAGNMARQPGMKLYEHRVVGDLVVSDKVMRQGFAIANHQSLDDAARQYVIDCFSEFLAS